MKRIITPLFLIAYLCGAADHPDVSKENVAYLKAVVALQGAETRKSDFPKEVGKVEAQIDQAISQAQQTAQKALAEARAKCETKKMILDDAAIKERMDFHCIEKIVADSDKKQ